jgi:hypothetical protein
MGREGREEEEGAGAWVAELSDMSEAVEVVEAEEEVSLKAGWSWRKSCTQAQHCIYINYTNLLYECTTKTLILYTRD